MTKGPAPKLITLPIWQFHEKYQRNLSPAPQPFPSLGPWSLTYNWYFDIFDILSLLLLLLFVLHLWVYQNFVYSKSHRWRIMPYYNHTSSTTFICVITKKNSNKKLTNKNDRTQPMKKSTSTSAFNLQSSCKSKQQKEKQQNTTD